ncbi:amidase family protein [Pseudonocardia sp. H11422]|uniref:amidase family protein n=1 Tax=Pseudonocardia sp. H11422 TaxID=2835866 RepID=UPI001BDC46BC|nr:amidase [Pseudonocardia sp. H11422]
MSATNIARAVGAGELTAVAAVEAALDRAARLDGAVRAFRELWPDVALAAATALDRRLSAGLPAPRLAGVPIGVKATEGVAGPHASALVAAGAVPIGATSTPRGPGPQTWGHTDRGPTCNPWRADLSPGGSSAGSAAAVATGIVPLATGSDGAGSVRIPAAWCGILGYKPTTGLLPTRDQGGLATPGPLASRAADLQLWAEVVLGGAPGPAAVSTLGWSADLGFAGPERDPEVVAIAERAARGLAARAGLWFAELPVALHDPAPAWTTLRDRAAEAPARAAAEALRQANDRALAVVFAATDLLATPTTPGPAHGHDGPGTSMSVALTWAFNLSGHPAISVPAGLTTGGCPVGLQIVARHRQDRVLLALARRAELRDPG